MRIILTLGAFVLVFTLVLGFGVHGVKGMDDLIEKISSLPIQIGRDVRDLTGALSDAIAASKQRPPPGPRLRRTTLSRLSWRLSAITRAP